MAFSPILLGAHNPGPMTGAGNNTYLLVGEDGRATLIDAGVGDARHLDAIRAELEPRGATLTDVLVTHGHSDHALGVTALATAHPGVRFHKHPWAEVDARYPVAWQAVEDGERLRAGGDWLTACHTPGHAPDHLVFWHEATRTAFVGDLVIRGASVMIDVDRGGSLPRYLASLERVAALEPALLLPAHGRPAPRAVATLAHHLAHRAERERQVVEALSAGLATVESITESIYDGLKLALVESARRNVRAHLEKLRSERRAIVDNGRWTLERTR